MHTLKALIVEDNTFMATVLQDMLQPYYKKLTVIGVAHSGTEAIQLVKRLKPDVVFLDIELPDMNGFELINKCSTITFQIIFTTTHSHYAIKAFRFNALDYLVKPIENSELKEAISKLKYKTSNHEKIKTALSNWKIKNITEQQLILPTQTGTLRFALKEIIYIESERNYSNIHLTNKKKVLSAKNLAYFELILIDKNFFRCHRSYLVNKHHISGLKNNTFVFKNGVIIPISRRRYSEAKQWYL